MSGLEVLSSPDSLSAHLNCTTHHGEQLEAEVKEEVKDDYDDEDYFDDENYDKDADSDIEEATKTPSNKLAGDGEGGDEQTGHKEEARDEGMGLEEDEGESSEDEDEELAVDEDETMGVEDAQEAKSDTKSATEVPSKPLKAKKETKETKELSFAKKAQLLRESAEKRKAMRHLAEQRKQQKQQDAKAEDEARKKKLKEAEYKKLLELKKRVREEGTRQNFNPNGAPSQPLESLAFQTNVSKSLNERLTEQREENLKKIKKREFTTTSHKAAMQEIKNIKEATVLRKEAGLSKAGESQHFQESLSRIKAQDDEEVRMNLTRELKTGYEKGRSFL